MKRLLSVVVSPVATCKKKLHLLEFAGSDFLTDTLGGV